jgi:hypothetical protein
MKHKKLLGSISCLLTLLLLFYVTLPAFSAQGLEQDAQVIPTEYEDYTVPGSSDGIEIQMDTGERPPVYEDGAILIYHYQQLLLIGTGAALTDTDYLSDGVGGGEAILCDDGDVLTYGMDSRYRIVNDIALPRHTMWQLPEGFCGSIAGEAAQDMPLYDEDEDIVWLYHPYQLAVTAAEDADVQPVMSGDADASTFGAGKVILVGDGYLTYSDTHRYVISSSFTTVTEEIPISLRRKTDLAATGAAAQYDGRDFAGQVVKEINGETYILIGNADQLRAIGTDAKVCGPVYKMKAANVTLTRYEVDTDRNGNPILLYGGDADLLQSQNGYADFSFQQITSEYPRAGVDQQTGTAYTGSTNVDLTVIGTAHSWETGEKYTTKANYIIFRDIDLGGSANPWTPLMFTGNMYGLKSTNNDKLWNGSAIGDATGLNERTTANRPVISNVYVNNSAPIEVDKFIGVGFFATVTNEINTADIGVSGGTVHVENIELNQVQVSNSATTAKSTQTIISALTSGLGWLVGGLVDVLVTALSFGSAELSLNDTLSALLNARAQDPTIYATGGFAGRVVGDVMIDNCALTGSVNVSNVKDNTGGFIGYSEGVTQYSGLSQALGITVDALSSLLNIIPGLGLGDLVTILLDNALPLGDLIPTGYLAPIVSDCEVEGLTGTLGGSEQNYSGGFIGQMIGTHIGNSSIRNGDYTVTAHFYGGGFCGIARDAEIKGTLDGVGIDLSSLIQNIHPQSVLIDCDISDCTYQVTGEDCLGGFVGVMNSSYAVDCTIDCASAETAVHADGNYAGGFAGYASVGWQSTFGKDENNENSLLGTVRQLLTGLLSTDKSTGQKLLSLMGVSPSAILGCQIYSGGLTVEAEGSFAGGLVGKGEGIVIAPSDQDAFDTIADWNSGTLEENPSDRPIILSGLDSVSAGESYAGGVAGYLGSAAFQGMLNDVVGLGDFIGFAVRDITVTGVEGGYTVSAGKYDAGGGFGCAVGGTIDNVQLNELKRVTAENRAAGFVGIAGPGELVGTGGLTVNLLGLDRVLEVSNLLNIGQGIEVHITGCTVTGIEDGFTVEATGTDVNNNVNEYTAAGFIADSNSTKITDSHVERLRSVTASDDHGYAGGFIGTSETGGLAEAANNDETSVKSLIEANGLLRAIGYLIPSYTNCTTTFVDAGYVAADIAGGFVADLESGTVDNSTIASVDDPDNPKWTKVIPELYDPDAVNPTGDLEKQFAVFNIREVRAKTYGGGFGGRLRSGALADAGGGISILGNTGLNINISDLLGVMNAYVPTVSHAGVYSSGGFTVVANDVREDDPASGSAGGFAGYMSGAQVSHCDVWRLMHTEVTPPDDLEAVDAPSYFDSSRSLYAVTGGRYAGGYVGDMDIGSAASLGSGLKILGNTIALDNLLSALSVVVSTIEHSDVQGAGGGFSVICDGTDSGGKVGVAGGYAGAVYGGHIQNSHCKNFYYIIGQEAAGGYVGTMSPGNVANLLDDGSILGRLINIDEALASLVEDFVPIIRNSTTSCVPCGGAVRAHSPSDSGHQRGCAGGYCGHNEGGHIWGLNTNTWKDQNDGMVGSHNYGHDTEGNYTGEQHICAAWRIRSVYGYEYAGGYTGYMESADTADTGNIKLLGSLISANNVLGALSMVYPTEENTAVYGPLRNLDVATWNLWVQYVGRYGGYGAELARAGTVSSQAELDAILEKYIYGCNVVAGRSAHDNMLITEGGSSGGYVGYMVTGVITNGQSYDMKLIRAMRSAGGYAGRMQTGAAAEFGSVSLLGLNLNLGQLVSAVQVFVPTVKSGSVRGWQSGMTVTAFGTGGVSSDVTNRCGYAGGYAGSVYGGQIWGDENVDDTPGTGCNVSNLRFVRGTNAAGGYVGLATAASVADVSTNASKGFLQRLLNTLIDTPGSLASVMQATVTTIRQAEITPDNSDFGFVVEGVGGIRPRFAGGFAGSLEASVIGSRKGESNIAVNGLRSVDGEYYAGGFVGLADVGSVASVSSTGTGSTNILKLIKAGSVDLLDVFRTYIYYSDVSGVDEGIVVRAYSSAPEGMLSETRYSGCAGGFGGGIMNGTVKNAGVTGLNTVTAPNYTGGFIGHAGKNGVADVDDAQVIGPLAGLTAGVLDVFGTVVDNGNVTGIGDGAYIASVGGEQPIAGGHTGYADVSQIKNSRAENLKQIRSDAIAGGFVGRTNMNYLVEAEVDSALVQVVLGILNALLKILQVHRLEELDLINTDSWLDNSAVTNLLGLKLLSDGDLLYVNLLGLRVGVSLVHPNPEDNSTGTAVVTIGDSSVELPYNEDGIDLNAENAEVVVNLIKGNRTRVDNCYAKGIPSGYDVYGGGADNDTDGSGEYGYAGGFVGYNNEGKFTSNVMEYCDVVRGADRRVGPFSGGTSLKSVYSFNTLASIEMVEGEENQYSVYRKTDLEYALTSAGQQIGSRAVADTGTPVGYNRVDVIHLASPIAPGENDPYYRIFERWKDAILASDPSGTDAAPIDVYESGAKAVLMLDKPTKPNAQSLIPEPEESQDPCDLITLTIRKIWDDLDDSDGSRPDHIRVRILQWQTDAQGGLIEGSDVVYKDSAVIPDVHPVEGWFMLSSADNALSGSATWRRVISGLPVSTTINSETVYYAYTVEEEGVEGYSTEITYSSDGFTVTIKNTHRPFLPFTGGFGDWLFILIGVGSILFAVTAFRRRRTVQPALAETFFRSSRGHPRRPERAFPRGSPCNEPRGFPRGKPRR